MHEPIESRKYEDGSFEIKDEPFYLPQGDEVELFEAAYENKLPVMLNGPTGCGKTRLIEYMAWKLKRPLYTVACHDDLSANDLIGRYLIKGDEVEWIDGPLLMAVNNGGISYLDEIVEARKDVTVVIHPLTDHRRYLPVEKRGKIFHAPKDFMLVISYNPNYQSVLKELKPSTKQRFVSFNLGWTDEELETAIRHGVKLIIADSLVEIERVDRIAGELGLKANLGIMVCTGVVPKGMNPFTATGSRKSQFGVDLEKGEAFNAYKNAVAATNINLLAMHCNIGSGVKDTDSYAKALR